jgi:hypothetical protein
MRSSKAFTETRQGLQQYALQLPTATKFPTHGTMEHQFRAAYEHDLRLKSSFMSLQSPIQTKEKWCVFC